MLAYKAVLQSDKQTTCSALRCPLWVSQWNHLGLYAAHVVISAVALRNEHKKCRICCKQNDQMEASAPAAQTRKQDEFPCGQESDLFYTGLYWSTTGSPVDTKQAEMWDYEIGGLHDESQTCIERESEGHRIDGSCLNGIHIERSIGRGPQACAPRVTHSGLYEEE